MKRLENKSLSVVAVLLAILIVMVGILTIQVTDLKNKGNNYV